MLLDSSNSVDKVGNALVSTWLRASVMQYSEVSGGKNDAESVVRSRGTLLIKNDRRVGKLVVPNMVLIFCYQYQLQEAEDISLL